MSGSSIGAYDLLGVLVLKDRPLGGNRSAHCSNGENRAMHSSSRHKPTSNLTLPKRASLHQRRRIERPHHPSLCSTVSANPHDEIGNDCNIEEKHDDLCDRGMPVDLKDLQRNQRAGNDSGEPLGPAFREPQTNPFG
jgi:hypothetical protein